MRFQQGYIGNRAIFRSNSAYIQKTVIGEERGSEPMGLDDLQFEAEDVAGEEE